MSKKTTPVQHVTDFFQNADESATTVMFEVVKSILAKRFAKEKPAVKRRGPNRPKDTPPKVLQTSGEDTGAQGNGL